MAQTGFTPISTYYTTTASAVPTAGNLVNGELALNINTADGKLFYKDSAGVVQVLATRDATSGAFTNLSYTGTLTGGTGIVNLGSGQFYKDASGNIGLGTTSPNSSGLTKALTINGTTNSILELNYGGTRGAYLFTNASNTVLSSVTNTNLLFNTNDVNRAILDTTGNFLVGTTTYTDANTGILNSANGRLYSTASSAAPLNLNRLTSTGDVAIFKYASNPVAAIALTSAGATYTGTNGITFTATQTASANANTLDDYEEGTFTATLNGVGGNPTVTYDQQIGTYTKIGNCVNVLLYIQTSARTGGSGVLQIAGLPFAQSSTANRMGGNVLLYAVNAGIGASSVWPNGASGNTIFTLLASNNNGSVWADVQVSGVPNSLAAIKVQITYLVDY